MRSSEASTSSFLLDAKENPYGEDDNKSPFPLQPKNKRSYAQNVTVWIKPNGLQVSHPLHVKTAAKSSQASECS